MIVFCVSTACPPYECPRDCRGHTVRRKFFSQRVKLNYLVNMKSAAGQGIATSNGSQTRFPRSRNLSLQLKCACAWDCSKMFKPEGCGRRELTPTTTPST